MHLINQTLQKLQQREIYIQDQAHPLYGLEAVYRKSNKTDVILWFFLVTLVTAWISSVSYQYIPRLSQLYSSLHFTIPFAVQATAPASVTAKDSIKALDQLQATEAVVASWAQIDPPITITNTLAADSLVQPRITHEEMLQAAEVTIIPPNAEKDFLQTELQPLAAPAVAEIEAEVIAQPMSAQIKPSVDTEINAALDFAASGQADQGIEQLTVLLQQDADNAVIRQALAGLLIKAQRFPAAISLLETGLTQEARNASYRKLLARVYIAQKSYTQARAVLAAHQPNLETDVEYYGLYAAVLQQLNATSVAIKIYDRLAQHQPNQVQWWIGLAVCYEALMNYSAAISAYKHGYELPNISTDTRQFLQRRLKQLSNPVSFHWQRKYSP